jgi:predicted phosphodiesterase
MYVCMHIMKVRLIERKIRCYCISDLHTDYKKNMRWWESQTCGSGDHNILIIAGDISHNLSTLRQTLRIANMVYDDVFFIPGNHDLWCSDGFKTSIDKLKAVLDICDETGVLYQPVHYEKQNLVIFPLFSWYVSSWDTEKDIVNPKQTSIMDRWNDFHHCKWPPHIMDIESYFSRMNTENLIVLDCMKNKKKCQTIITFSHFIPRQELLPEKRFLVHSDLPKVVGSNELMRQIERIGPKLHIFGHSHIPMDMVIDGIRYVQWSLGNVRERSLQCKNVSNRGALCVYRDCLIGVVQSTYWGSTINVLG